MGINQLSENPLAAVYGRVSTDCQDGSIETQLESCRRFAGNNGLAIPEELIFLDQDASGSLPLKEREQGRLMMNSFQIYGKRVRHLIVAKLDRLGRSLIDLQLTVAELEQTGISVHFCNLPLPAGEDGMGKALRTLFLQMLSAFAEFERNMIVERINDRMATKRARGELCGTIPFGWNAIGTGQFRSNKAGQTKEIRRLEPNPEEQKWLRKMAEWRQAKWSFNRIAQTLNECGVPSKTGLKWQCGNVAKVLSSSYARELLGVSKEQAA
jgi:DNA invertase Pin-like site-specific DNA recombinase